MLVLANAERARMVMRLCEDWESGVNQFDKEGEALFIAAEGLRVVGVCGLNRDEGGRGRVRRMYVMPDDRRNGVGAALLRAVCDAAKTSFTSLVLMTDREPASAFYEANGFQRVTGVDRVTHQKTL